MLDRLHEVAKLEGFQNVLATPARLSSNSLLTGRLPPPIAMIFIFLMLALRCRNGVGFSLLGRGAIHGHEGMELLMRRIALLNDLYFLDLVSCLFHGRPYNHPKIQIVSDDKNAVCCCPSPMNVPFRYTNSETRIAFVYPHRTDFRLWPLESCARDTKRLDRTHRTPCWTHSS